MLLAIKLQESIIFLSYCIYYINNIGMAFAIDTLSVTLTQRSITMATISRQHQLKVLQRTADETRNAYLKELHGPIPNTERARRFFGEYLRVYRLLQQHKRALRRGHPSLVVECEG